MSNVIVRGLPSDLKQEVVKMAILDNLSMNQELVQLLKEAISQRKLRREKEANEKEAFDRVLEIRERIRAKYGRFGDSVDLIRDDRESH